LEQEDCINHAEEAARNIGMSVVFAWTRYSLVLETGANCNFLTNKILTIFSTRFRTIYETAFRTGNLPN